MAHVRQCKIPVNVHMRSFLQVISYVLTDGDTSLTLGAVLAFATGLQRIPAVGFPIGPRLEFLHEEDGPALFPLGKYLFPGPQATGVSGVHWI